MQSKKINPFVQWWVTPKLPKIHLKDEVASFKKYFLHPIKRRLAKYYLSLLQKFTSIKVIAITGSAGKTTTKEMLASILRQVGSTFYSRENIDPVYNIPDTILKTLPWAKYLILEMGVEYPGEMDFYLWLAKVDVGVITNIFPAHTEFLGNVEGVLKEKSKLVRSLSKEGVAILNSDDKKLLGLSKGLRVKIVWFKSGKSPFEGNANAARTTAQILGVGAKAIERGLASYKKPPHRLEIVKHKSGATLLDDSYNSNPWAALSTLEYFNKLAGGKKVAVLGDMLELGSYDEEGHRELGREVAKSDFEVVIGVGKSTAFLVDEVKERSKLTKTFLVPNVNLVMPVLKPYLTRGTYILIKGSRSIGLDRLVEELS